MQLNQTYCLTHIFIYVTFHNPAMRAPKKVLFDVIKTR